MTKDSILYIAVLSAQVSIFKILSKLANNQNNKLTINISLSVAFKKNIDNIKNVFTFVFELATQQLINTY